jgi:DNA-binding transcriptional LysR family regulator
MFMAGARFLDTVSHNSIGGYSIRVGIQETISASVPAAFVSQYWDDFAQYGTVNTARSPSADDAFEAIQNGFLDWALTLEKPRRRNLAYLEVDTFELAFCCSEHLYTKFRNPEDILRTIPLARSSYDSKLNEAVNDYLQSHQIYPEETIETDHLEFCIDLVQRGRCVALFAKKTLAASTWGRDLKVFQIGEPIRLRLYAVWLPTNERMISIVKLKELLTGSSPHLERSQDPDFQLRINQVPDDLLKSPPENEKSDDVGDDE